MEINIYQVDAFTSNVFGGNPAGVVPDASELSEEDMKKVAREMNLSETAFIVPIDKENYKVRFFTPVCEVDLCGHATIGSFFTMAQKGYIQNRGKEKIKVFQNTKAGKLPVEIYYKNGKVDKVFMQQGKPKSIKKIEEMKKLLKAFNLGEEDIGIGTNFVCPEIINTGLSDIMLPIKEKRKLDNLEVDFNELACISNYFSVAGVHAFYFKEGEDIVYTRNFAPAVGIDEEAATGTANGALIYFLKENKFLKGNNLLSIQGESLNRASKIYCYIDEIDGKYVVKVGGQAQIAIEGILCF
jgi:PhzF family phenazine biosynthesis protein